VHKDRRIPHFDINPEVSGRSQASPNFDRNRHAEIVARPLLVKLTGMCASPLRHRGEQ
jgi:hypothetical protein